MSILSLIEDKIGWIHNWPQNIIRQLFYIRRPTYSMAGEIAAFSFGNKIQLEDTLELIEEYCTGRLCLGNGTDCRLLSWVGDSYIPLTIFGSCDRL